MSSPPSQPRLGPAWRSASQGGRGFQPPSAAPDTDETKNSNRNSFSLLDMDDDNNPRSQGLASKSSGNANGASSGSSGISPRKAFTSRSEGLRSAGVGSGGFGTRSMSSSKGSGTSSGSSGVTGGRSLADLASRFPSSGGGLNGRRSSHHSSHGGFDDTEGRPGAMSMGRSSSLRDFVDDKKVIRFTREKLLSMRPRAEPGATHPAALNCIEGLPLLSKEPLDPVCWDNFDAEEIWQLARERRASSKGGASSLRRDGDVSERRGSQVGRTGMSVGDRWQRGVALPPSDRNAGRAGSRGIEADNPDDLWDDPVTSTGAAADFSAFGGSLDDDPKVSTSGGDTFNFAIMAEQAKKFDDDFHDRNSDTDGKEDENHDHAVNPSAPLASAGTTIRSGSGDNVNVFEDFEESPPPAVDEPIKAGDSEAQSVSSRLMQMIGVTPEGEKTGEDESKSVEDNSNVETQAPATDASSVASGGYASSVPSNPFASSAVSSNPWGDPIHATPAPAPSESVGGGLGGGLDLAEKLRAAQLSENAELMRRKQEEEEKRRAAMAAHQAELERQASMQQQHAHTQVELVLAERISTILENSWGRSDLLTILQTLHSDDARVIPLLGSVDALRALVARHPRRFALAKDPTFGAEMAVLVMNNAQWQQQRANEELQQLQRRQQEERMLAAKKEAEARAKAEAEAEARARAEAEPIVITDAPWYYADPQGNIQGPFGGDEMRQWLEAGYFKGDLPISQSQNGPFRALSLLFPDSSVAFRPSGPSEEEKARIAEMEARAAAEAAAKAEAEARELAAKEAKAMAEAEAARQAEIQSHQNQSAQLKILLGLGSSSAEPAAVKEEDEKLKVDHIGKLENDHTSNDNVVKQQNEPAPQSKASKSKGSKKKSNEEVANSVVPEPVPAPVPAPTPAWGGAGTTKKATKRTSMSEIQKEEARVAAQHRKTNPQGSGGWANIAASGGTTAWSGANVRPAPSTTVVPSTSKTSVHQGMSTNKIHQKASTQRSATQNTLDEFGAGSKMTPALESWCKDQMRKLNGSEDLTLVAFCMTLTDPVEIKQYLTAYLGSTPQVNNFASEFIQHKNGTKAQEQWETTSSSKKGRKKKGSSGK